MPIKKSELKTIVVKAAISRKDWNNLNVGDIIQVDEDFVLFPPDKHNDRPYLESKAASYRARGIAKVPAKSKFFVLGKQSVPFSSYVLLKSLDLKIPNCIINDQYLKETSLVEKSKSDKATKILSDKDMEYLSQSLLAVAGDYLKENKDPHVAEQIVVELESVLKKLFKSLPTKLGFLEN